jgi:hypothetical protein
VPPFIVGISVKPTSALRQLAANLRRAPQTIRRDVAARLRAEVKQLIDRGFVTKMDPYGSQWKPPQDGGRTMQRTGRLRKGFTIEAKPDGSGIQLRVLNKQDYAQWLQEGTAKMEARRMVPDGPMPFAWQALIERSFKYAVQAWLMRSRSSGGGGA